MPETDEKKHPILTDKPAGRDALDFQPYIEALADLITDPAAGTPITVGVFGRWGSGKTSLMRLIKQQVDDKGYETVWFNAWKYEREALAMWRVLILRTLDALRPRDDDGNLYALDDLAPDDQKLLKELDVLEESVYRTVEWTELGKWTVDWAKALESTGEFAADIALSMVPGAGQLVGLLRKARNAVKGDDISPIVEAFQRESQSFRREQLRSIEQFIDGFENLIKNHVVERNRRLVVFVDDLDRCLPERTVEVLEAIKLFLDAEGCIFVLGVDPAKVQEGIRIRYEGNLSPEEGADYLEKIIQLPFILPAIDPADMSDFIKDLTVDFPHYGCVEVFARGLEPNPRQVKRAINVFLLLWKLVKKRRLDLKPVRLAKLVVIQHSHANLYELLKLVPRYLGDLEVHFLRRRDAQEAARRGGTGDGEAKPERGLPPALEKFGSRPALQTLFTLLAEEDDASFRVLTPTALRSYITLTGRAVAEGVRPARQAVSREFEPEMVAVPATRFLMGSSHQDAQAGIAKEDETPQHWLDLPACQLGRFPVTNLEYWAFVKATGHPPPQHWNGDAPPDGLTDHPVVNVSWHEAVAYCRWLAESTGKSYRLPTEAEWERAASWAGESGANGQKRRYPWGDEFEAGKCNTEEAGIGATTPAGDFSPAGDSPAGCADMAGNVWEWCSTQWQEKAYPFLVQDEWAEEYLSEEKSRVLRGGSFYDNKSPARVSSRYRSLRNHGNWDIGFRVIRPHL